MQKILVIDDEPTVRELIHFSLRSKGFIVMETDNGDAGIQLARSHVPDLILLDVFLPKLDGFEVLARLRKDSATAVIPCILMTGQPDSAGMRQGMSLGADDYLAKPFTVEELVSAVEARFKKQDVLRQQVERKLADLRSNISLALPHELFTPLSGIIGFAEIISTEATSLQPNEIAEIGRSIHLSAKRLYRLVENFLIYAQIELLAIDPQKVASIRQGHTAVSHEIIENRSRLCAQTFNRLEDLVVEVSPGPACISEEYLSKIVDELIENAFKFCEAGTPIKVISKPDENGLTFMVCDRGHGMNPEHIANIGAYMQFERRFYEQQGSGLGLTIAKRLAELHGGNLSLQSTVGKGTMVSVSIPHKSDRPADEPSPPSDTVNNL
jgi:two-component system, sensor histidine kinase and response regulator